MSPGTSAPIGSSLMTGDVPGPARRCVAAVVWTMARSAAAARPERRSCTVATPTLSITITAITPEAS
ncbi:hypothetical protein ACU4HD_05160 [Cupriavidus basilensis]